MPDKKQPNFWWTVVKLVLGAIVLLGAFWMFLSFLASYSEEPARPPSSRPKMDWGIANDSPIPSRR